MLTSAKLRRSKHQKVYFLNVYLRTKFEISSRILTRFRQRGLILPPPQPQNEPVKSSARLGLKWKQHFHTITFHELPTLEYGCLMELNTKKGTRQRQGTLVTNHCLICHCLYDEEELTVPGSSNFMAHQKVLCERYERKICYILFS